jgi:hypothetical protein
LILGWLTADATAAGMQQLPWLTDVAIGTPEKMGVIVTHFWREVMFSLSYVRDFGQAVGDNESRNPLNSPESLTLEPFPAEWKAISPVRVGMSDWVVGIPNALEFGTELIPHLGLARMIPWHDQFVLCGS